MTERAQKLRVGTPIDIFVRPENLKFFIDQDWLASMTELELFKDSVDYEKLADECFRAYMDSKSNETIEVATIEAIDKIVESELRTDMNDSYSRLGMEFFCTVCNSPSS